MLARETARYAVHDHGDQAEEHLLARIRRLRSRKRRRIYRIAIREIQRVTGTTDKASRDAMAKDDLHGVAVDALALIAKATRQIEDATSEIQGSPHRHAFFFAAARLRDADKTLRARTNTQVSARPIVI